jgi:hypothetical protein
MAVGAVHEPRGHGGHFRCFHFLHRSPKIREWSEFKVAPAVRTTLKTSSFRKLTTLHELKQ